MDKLKQNYDRVLLTVIGLVTIIAGGMLMMKSFAIGNKFSEVEPGDGDEQFDTKTEEVADAMAHSDKTVNWEAQKDPNSPRVFRLMASVEIVQRGDEEIDMSDPKTELREGVSNKYLTDHNLPYTRDDVLDLDTDGDGFSNREEYELGETNPRDKDDYPDPTHKLKLASVDTENYELTFKSKSGDAATAEFSIAKSPPTNAVADRKKRWSVWTKSDTPFPEEGKTSEDDADRFKVLGYEEKEVHTAGTSARKIEGVVTIEDSTSKQKIELVRRLKTNIPIYRAVCRYEIPPHEGELGPFAKGDTFKLPGTEVEVTINEVTATGMKAQYKTAGGNPKPLVRTLNN